MNTKEDKLKIFALIIGLSFIIGFPIYTAINQYFLNKNGIKTKAIVVKKDKVLGGKPVSYSYYLTVKFNVNGKYKIKEIGIPSKAYRWFSKNDTVFILQDPKNKTNIKWVDQ
ncbi:hypothetical protein [Tenacibaculum sp. M341]|uniref:hypothetical protein n=1 Tax=Tenacibaculum sp. M341 TaxID=2530339 RepID=UPI0010516B7F|nr:hypothetical protein [Tenacibaculum sp. M341]TCI85455.1 hypothetical protein EYW44_17040 [Tenacibaculum sp. M341]